MSSPRNRVTRTRARAVPPPPNIRSTIDPSQTKAITEALTSNGTPLINANSNSSSYLNVAKDNAFDQVESERLERLSAEFQHLPVDNLPLHLEEEISKYNSSNSMMLISNSKTLSVSSTALHSILNNARNLHSAASEMWKQLNPITEHLKSANQSKDTDNTTSQNRSKVIEHIKSVLNIALINDSWKQALGNPNFEDINNLPNLYNILQDVTKELTSEKDLPGIEGYQIAKERRDELKMLSNRFSEELELFCSKQFNSVDNVNKSRKINTGSFNYQEIPTFDKVHKQFSVDVTQHEYLKAIYPYWKFLYWHREHYPTEYLELIDNKYIPHITKKIDQTFDKLIRDEIDLISSLPYDRKAGNSAISSEPFAPGKEALKPNGATISQSLRTLFKDCFKAIETEIVVLREFWAISEENISKYNLIISPFTQDNFSRVINLASQIDPYFYFLSYSVITARAKQTGLHYIPLKNLVSLAEGLNDQFIEGQISRLKDSKFNTRKSLLLTQVNSFPIFVTNFYKAHSTLDIGEGDKEVLESMMVKFIDELDHWLNEDVLPKFTHSKCNRTHILNLNHILNQFKEPGTDNYLPFIAESALLTNKMEIIKKEYDETINQFMDWLCYKIWDKPSEFFTQINEWKENSGLTSEMVTFQPSHTQDKFAELSKDLDKKKENNEKEMRNYVNQKIRDEKLRKDILDELIPHTEGVFQKWNTIAQECYGKPFDISMVNKVQN